MRVAAVIPARNEATTVGTVVAAALRAGSVSDVVVVDNASTDATAAVASAAGARVVACHEKGKGQAMAVGVAAVDADVVVFLDADLLGLRPEHVDRLVLELEDDVAMAMGLFDRGAMQNAIFLNALPILTGQRSLRRELFALLDPEDYRGYKVEAALNALCRDLGMRTRAFVCDGLFHRPKEEKEDSAVVGFLKKQWMLLTAVWGSVSYRLRRLGARATHRR